MNAELTPRDIDFLTESSGLDDAQLTFAPGATWGYAKVWRLAKQRALYGSNLGTTEMERWDEEIVSEQERTLGGSVVRSSRPANALEQDLWEADVLLLSHRLMDDPLHRDLADLVTTSASLMTRFATAWPQLTAGGRLLRVTLAYLFVLAKRPLPMFRVSEQALFSKALVGKVDARDYLLSKVRETTRCVCGGFAERTRAAGMIDDYLCPTCGSKTAEDWSGLVVAVNQTDADI